MRRGLSGSFVLDASILVEFALGTPLGLRLEDVLEKEQVVAYATEVGTAEVRYVICRMLGSAESKDRVDKLLASGYVQVEEVSFLVEAAARLKCERAVSLADCFCLALAQHYQCSALFARREAELAKEMQRKPLGIDVLFLEDFA
jgi:predicted nucleic acid-binding protein